MATLVNPMDAFETFEPALKAGELAIQNGTIRSDLLVHLDHPNGEMRLTYALPRGETIAAIAIIVPAGAEDGLPVFQLGYAVRQHLRKRGLGKEIANAAIEEFSAGMFRNSVKKFKLEAMVGTNNVASQKVAEAVIGGQTRETVDENSGEAIVQYMRILDDS